MARLAIDAPNGGPRYAPSMQAFRPPNTPRAATYEDLLAVPDHLTAELIDGQIYAMARPRVKHADSNTAMASDLRSSFGRRKPGAGPGGWVILSEPELHLGTPDPKLLVLAPDLAGWRRERMPEAPDTPAVELVPDWVCEVLSPGTESHDRIRKMEWYGRSGVRWAWIVDANARSVEVYEHDGRIWQFHGGVVGGSPARLQPFEAVEFDLSEWWAPEAAVPPTAT